MKALYGLVIVVITLAVAAPVEAQWRQEASYSTAAPEPPPQRHGPLIEARSRASSPRIGPIALGAGIGAVVGVAAYYFTGYQDEYCRSPDLIPCEPVFVLAAAGGAGWGALAAYLLSGPR